MTATLILIIILTSSLSGLVLIFIYSRLTGVVPMPSSVKERDIVVSILYDYKGIRRITDLGSGWGGLVRHLALRLRDREIRAIERSPLPYYFSQFITYMAGLKNVSHSRIDYNDIRLESGRAYVCYLSGPAMKRIREKFEKDLPEKGLLISVAFAMPRWTPTRVEYAESLFHSPVYIYEY